MALGLGDGLVQLADAGVDLAGVEFGFGKVAFQELVLEISCLGPEGT
jgi:hypothetical protein